MTDEEFRGIFEEASSEVADRFYPKGMTDRRGEYLPDRGEYLRDQAVLYVGLVKRLSARGYLKEG